MLARRPGGGKISFMIYSIRIRKEFGGYTAAVSRGAEPTVKFYGETRVSARGQAQQYLDQKFPVEPLAANVSDEGPGGENAGE